jgi:glycosyltransferase involved in cell wall biosynthesis
LAERYQALARRVEVLPCFWNQGNLLWDRPAPRRQTINLGVAGTHILPEDTLSLKNDLARLLRKHPHTLLVAAQDLRLYQAFSAIPEERRLFLPAGRLEDYPYLLANFDILLVPQQDNPYNQARSDQPLLEAGVRGIPWIASPVPAFKEWGAGGLFAEKPGDWSGLLKQLLEDAGLRRELGEAGRQKAGSRKVSQALAGWQAILFG